MTAESIVRGLEKTINLIEEIESVVENEENTITQMVHPFIADVLGYDLRRDVKHKVKVGHRRNKSERREADIALSMGLHKKHHILMEVKKYTCGEHDLEGGLGQLREYVSLEQVSFGVLTNGRSVRLYTDTEVESHMDPQPYGIFNLTKKDFNKNKQAIIDCLLPLHKSDWDKEKSRDKAHHMYRLNQIKERLEHPSDELLNYICKGLRGVVDVEQQLAMYKEVMSSLIHTPSQRNKKHPNMTPSGRNASNTTIKKPLPPKAEDGFPQKFGEVQKNRKLSNDIDQPMMKSQPLKQSYVTCSFTKNNKSLTFSKGACDEFLNTLGMDNQKDSVKNIHILLVLDSDLNRIYFKLYPIEPAGVKARKLNMRWEHNKRPRIRLSSEFYNFFESNTAIKGQSGVKINLNYDSNKGQYYIES